jgi:hypothetical protein
MRQSIKINAKVNIAIALPSSYHELLLAGLVEAAAAQLLYLRYLNAEVRVIDNRQRQLFNCRTVLAAHFRSL